MESGEGKLASLERQVRISSCKNSDYSTSLVVAAENVDAAGIRQQSKIY